MLTSKQRAQLRRAVDADFLPTGRKPHHAVLLGLCPTLQLTRADCVASAVYDSCHFSHLYIESAAPVAARAGVGVKCPANATVSWRCVLLVGYCRFIAGAARHDDVPRS